MELTWLVVCPQRRLDRHILVCQSLVAFEKCVPSASVIFIVELNVAVIRLWPPQNPMHPFSMSLRRPLPTPSSKPLKMRLALLFVSLKESRKQMKFVWVLSCFPLQQL